MRTKLEIAHDVCSIGTFVLTIVVIVLMVIPMLWPTEPPQQSAAAAGGHPLMIGWVMPSILAFCLLLAGVLQLLAARTRHRPSLASPAALQRMPLPVFSPPPPVLPVLVPPLEEKIFVGPDITPQFLTDIARNHTYIQASKMLEIYIGKWMKVSGVISNVSQISTTLTMVIWSGSVLQEIPSIYLMFDGQWFDRLSI